MRDLNCYDKSEDDTGVKHILFKSDTSEQLSLKHT